MAIILRASLRTAARAGASCSETASFRSPGTIRPPRR